MGERGPGVGSAQGVWDRVYRRGRNNRERLAVIIVNTPWPRDHELAADDVSYSRLAHSVQIGLNACGDSDLELRVCLMILKPCQRAQC